MTMTDQVKKLLSIHSHFPQKPLQASTIFIINPVIENQLNKHQRERE